MMALRRALLFCLGLATQQTPMAFALQLHGNAVVVGQVSQVAGQELNEAEIANAFRGAVARKTKGGKKGGKKGGDGGVMGFFQKMVIKQAANQVFKQFDRDRNGHLDARELNEALGSVTRIIGINPSQSMVIQALQMFDCDGSGTLDNYEFYLMCRQLQFLSGGGTGKHHKLIGKTLTGCSGHRPGGFMPHGPSYGHGAGFGHGHGPGYGQGPAYGPQYGHAPAFNPGPGYGQYPDPSYAPGPGYGAGPSHGPNHGYGHGQMF